MSLNSSPNDKFPETTSSKLSLGHCQECATPLQQQRPPGDDRLRLVCPNCNKVFYDNPKLVVGCVPISKDQNRVLLGKRAYPPIGKWTIPAGFLESGETAHQGAAREAWEEMRAELDLQPLTILAMYNVIPAKQVQILYRSTLLNEAHVQPGPEMQEVRMFEWNQIPWDQLAFPTVEWALRYSLHNLNNKHLQPQLKSK